MKRIISAGLSIAMLAASLTACAVVENKQPALDPAITLASSDAAEMASWLDERLDKIPDDVVMGIGSDTGYGIDMTDFEDDGYILRELNGDVLIFGKTAEGLDLAVRKYAKAAEDGQSADLDVTYHEGYRVKKLTIADKDISEYTILYDFDREVKNAGSNCGANLGRTFGNTKYAAEELNRLLKQATGVDVQYKPKTEGADGPIIQIDYYTGGDLGENGFTYEVKDGNVYIQGVGEVNGCANAVYYFLEHQCGWEDLLYGDSDLQESDHVNVPNGVSVTMDPLFDYTSMRQMYYDTFENDRSAFSKNYMGVAKQASHGIRTFSGVGDPWSQICYTDGGNLEITVANVVAYCEKQMDAGRVLGEDLCQIDIGQNDAFGYCICTECLNVYREENSSHAGSVIRFMNSLSDEVTAWGYGGLIYSLYAYHGSNNPCATAPNDYVYVTFCTDGHCSAHPLNGSECLGGSFDQAGWISGGPFNNNHYAEWLRGWSELSDNIYVWYYSLTYNLHAYSILGHLYDDLALLRECGVKGFQPQQDYWGYGNGRIIFQMIMKMQWDPDMTEDEFNLVLADVMEKEYGEGWEYIYEYHRPWEESRDRTGKCWNCWGGYGNDYGGYEFDSIYYAEQFDTMYEMFEKAIYLADSAEQEQHCEMLSTHMIYTGCLASYFAEYDEGDTERIGVLSARWDEMCARLLRGGKNLKAIQSQDSNKISIEESLEDQAWMNWYNHREEFTREGVEPKAAPDKYDEYYASLEAAE